MIVEVFLLTASGEFPKMHSENMRERTIPVQPGEETQRLDIFLAGKTGVTRSQIQILIEKGEVSVNGRVVTRNYKVKVNDVITLHFPRQETETLLPEKIPVKILYEDEYVVVVDKPAGMVVYPAAGHKHGTLMNALSYYCGKLAAVGGPLRPGVVHRLDRDTSGVMVVAVEDGAYYNLVGQFRERTVKKKYVVLVYGDIRAEAGDIMLPIGRSETDRKKMSTRVKRGKEAVTRWKVVERFGIATLIEVRLGTGRTHQIRVHLSSIGHPVLGDKVYGRKTELEIKKRKVVIPRQMLHAEMLGFTHPSTGEYIEFSSPIPDDMREAIGVLRSAY